MTTAAAIVPAFDEPPRIGRTLRALTEAAFLDRILVVDDGSTDGTADAILPYVRKDAVDLVRHRSNLGKGAALQTGLDALRPEDADVVLFLDADLIGLRKDHLEALIRPLSENARIGMSVGRFVKGRFSVDLQQKWFAVLNGQRALSSWFIRSLPDLSWSRFGVEVLLSRYAREQKVQVAAPLLEGITHVPKEEKYGFRRGFPARLNMYREALAAHFRYRAMMSGHRSGEAQARTP